MGFVLASYDTTRELVIDPVLEYSTYLGGSSFDYGRGIAVDGAGSAYVTGYTQSTNFPTQNPFQAANAGIRNAFVAKWMVPLPLALAPAAATVSPRETVTFAASGGSGTGFVFSLQTNGSGAMIDPATGVYTAGSTTPSSDVVKATDSLGNTATANVTVNAPPPDAGADADAGGADASVDASDASADAADSGRAGCGCRTAGAPATGSAGWLALLAVAALGARRRRG